MPNNKPLSFGGHALVWAGDWSEASARGAAASAKRAGYDYIEMLMIDPDSIDVAMTKDVLDEYGLFATASLGLSPATDVT
ncbi:MAG: sugar phosphate isomerase/epimerase, partial [Candidatus Planktophila sp.]|nr:sugar phosphate isomerase/epimerase [Candidatus Planktophila sp.]